MAVEFYHYGELGYMIDPESDTKTIFIPSPPTPMTVKINPRPAMIYVTGGKINENYARLDELKAYCEEHKLVFVCPTAVDAETLGETYKYITTNEKKLNVKIDELSIRFDASNKDAADEFVNLILDELDGDVEDAEIFELN